MVKQKLVFVAGGVRLKSPGPHDGHQRVTQRTVQPRSPEVDWEAQLVGREAAAAETVSLHATTCTHARCRGTCRPARAASNEVRGKSVRVRVAQAQAHTASSTVTSQSPFEFKMPAADSPATPAPTTTTRRFRVGARSISTQRAASEGRGGLDLSSVLVSRMILTKHVTRWRLPWRPGRRPSRPRRAPSRSPHALHRAPVRRQRSRDRRAQATATTSPHRAAVSDTHPPAERCRQQG